MAAGHKRMYKLTANSFPILISGPLQPFSKSALHCIRLSIIAELFKSNNNENKTCNEDIN